MKLANELKAAGLPVFPCAVSYDEQRGKWSKRPLTVDREPWARTALRSVDDARVRWDGCKVLGVPVPAGVCILDLDTYVEGCSVEAISELFGCAIPWAEAALQTTIGGGAHYAFRCPEGWEVRQGQEIATGFDTRVSGLGFICCGEGYTPSNTFGVLRLLAPESLPVLPDGCRELLERKAHTPAEPAPLPRSDDRDTEALIAALHHVSPEKRDVWRNTGFALKHHFHDDDATGFALWDAWSRGAYTESQEVPEGYTRGEHMQRDQWDGFHVSRADGATITIGSVFHAAMRGGWRPPAKFDASAAFGAGAVGADAFSALVDRILEDGADSRNVEGILTAITNSGCNDMQALLLRAELKSVMKGAQLLDKDMAGIIDKATAPAGGSLMTAHAGMYNKNHTENAEIFIAAHYAEGKLIRSNQIWYVYDGKSWVEVDDDAIDAQLTRAMQSSRPQKSTVNGTYQTMCSLGYRNDVRMNEDRLSVVLFQNGALDLYSGELLPHSQTYATTKIVPYEYAPQREAPTWLAFLNDVFESDPQRVALLQEWFGYMLSPTYQYHKIMLLLGAPRSGKGTIGHIIKALVGKQNYSGCALSSFAKDDFLDSMRNVTVAFSGDTAKKVHVNVAETVAENMKKISGNDAVDFARKYKSRLSCVLPCRITLAANHVPRLFDDSGALAGRLLVLPFEVSFANREDPALLGKLLAEVEGIAVWALQGLARLNANRCFTSPDASEGDVQLIAESYSPLRQFIDARCLLGTENAISCADLHDEYRAWAVQECEAHILSRKMFVSAFKDATRGKGCKYGSHRNGDGVFRGFKGVTVLAPGEPTTAGAFKPSIV